MDDEESPKIAIDIVNYQQEYCGPLKLPNLAVTGGIQLDSERTLTDSRWFVKTGVVTGSVAFFVLRFESMV